MRLDRMPPELRSPPCPEQVLYVWRWYQELALRRQSNGFGPLPITHSEIEAWAKRRGIALSAWEQDALDALEEVFLRVQAGLPGVEEPWDTATVVNDEDDVEDVGDLDDD
jgi:hypothetical protein